MCQACPMFVVPVPKGDGFVNLVWQAESASCGSRFLPFFSFWHRYVSPRKRHSCINLAAQSCSDSLRVQELATDCLVACPADWQTCYICSRSTRPDVQDVGNRLCIQDRFPFLPLLFWGLSCREERDAGDKETQPTQWGLPHLAPTCCLLSSQAQEQRILFKTLEGFQSRTQPGHAGANFHLPFGYMCRLGHPKDCVFLFVFA